MVILKLHIERSMKFGKRGFKEENATDLEKRKKLTKKDIQLPSFQTIAYALLYYISVMALYIDWLGKENTIETDVLISVKS